MDKILIFDSLEEADEYASKNTNAHQNNDPVTLTPELLQALSTGKAVAIGINGWEYAVILVKKT